MRGNEPAPESLRSRGVTHLIELVHGLLVEEGPIVGENLSGRGCAAAIGSTGNAAAGGRVGGWGGGAQKTP